MPRHPISDAHEWVSEISSVPVYCLAKSQPWERVWTFQRGKKTLLSLTLVSCEGWFGGCRICGSSRFTEIPLPLKPYVLLGDVTWYSRIYAFDGNQSDWEFGWGGTSVKGQRRCSKCWLNVGRNLVWTRRGYAAFIWIYCQVEHG